MKPRRKRPVAERFWSKVKKTAGCWLWSGSLCSNGYGQFFFDARLRPAHQIAWQLAFGPIPAGLWVLHHCDVRNCVNPSHLFLGDREANTRDMLAKGRSVRGERNGHAKLCEADILEIRILWARGSTQQSIADLFEISQTLVSDIVHGRRWGHVRGGQVEVRA